jgi:hypothetical protein
LYSENLLVKAFRNKKGIADMGLNLKPNVPAANRPRMEVKKAMKTES